MTPSSRLRARRAVALLVTVTSLAVFVLGGALLDRLVGYVVPTLPVQVAHPPNFHSRRTSLDFSVDFRTNSQGLRYPEIPVKKPAAGEFRVIVLGDSTVEGWGVESDETFMSVLEKTFSSANRRMYFINGGLSGTGPLQYGRLLGVVGLKYQPDLVLIALHPNDVNDTPVGAELGLERGRRGEYQVRAPPAVAWAPGGLVHKTAHFLFPWTYGWLQDVSAKRDEQHRQELGFLDVVRARAKLSGISDAAVQYWVARLPPELLAGLENPQFNLTPKSAVLRGLFDPDFWTHCLEVEGAESEAKWASMRHILSETVSLCREASVKCAFVYVSTPAQYDDTRGPFWRRTGIRMRPEWLTGQSELERRLGEWARQSEVPFLSLTDGLRKAAAERPGAYNFEFDEHWNVAGHQLVAGLIGAWLRERALVPAN